MRRRLLHRMIAAGVVALAWSIAWPTVGQDRPASVAPGSAKPRLVVQFGTGVVQTVAFSPDGKLVLTGSADTALL